MCPCNEVPNNTTLLPIASTSKHLTSTETWYSNLEREAQDILHGLEKSHHYCFACEVSMVTNLKPLVGANIQEGGSNPVTKVTEHSAVHPLIQHHNPV